MTAYTGPTSGELCDGWGYYLGWDNTLHANQGGRVVAWIGPGGDETRFPLIRDDVRRALRRKWCEVHGWRVFTVELHDGTRAARVRERLGDGTVISSPVNSARDIFTEWPAPVRALVAEMLSDTEPAFPGHERTGWDAAALVNVCAWPRLLCRALRVKWAPFSWRLADGFSHGKTSAIPRGEGNRCPWYPNDWDTGPDPLVGKCSGKRIDSTRRIADPTHGYTAVHEDELGDVYDRLAVLEKWRRTQEDDGR